MVKIKTRPVSGLVQKKRFMVDLLMIPYCIITLALILMGVKILLSNNSLTEAMPSSTYQAVFLANGQVYFGHLKQINKSYFSLRDVYYIREDIAGQSETADETDAANPDTTTPQTAFSVVRLGEEIHQPQNALILNADQIVFWENLQTDSRVISAIAEEQATRE
jgi:hypothetical protein